MSEYHRLYIPGASWFFTVVVADRKKRSLLLDNIATLRQAFRYVKQRHPFNIDAVVVLPDHLHCMWTLPEGDSDFSTRWNLLKGHFSRSLEEGERVINSRSKRGERGIWQRRFWEHMIRDQVDFNQHVDYIHWNPVKHGYVAKVSDWPYSSFHRYVKAGIYSENWGHAGDFELETGE
ncbi:transposase [Methylomarinum sp. Ch1-1]|uniref:Transposase n=1 Tax=Methylomarinum roseum TaxID=3067653 RepID=A0AAU7NQC3_9GAMM|nr:transposase [Methylomarinum sp. Ch1-1]MDP4520886.1 transposase [Methylomarinum sp. Ch1-1]